MNNRPTSIQQTATTNERTQLTMVQPNIVTNARYEYCQMEKDIMYHIIEALQTHMSKEKPMQSDLFGNIGIELEMKDICKSNNHK